MEAPCPARLLFEGRDEALAESVLLRGVLFLGEPVVPDDAPVSAGSEDQAVVVPKAHARRGATEGSEAAQKRLLQGPLLGLGPAAVLSTA